MRSSPPLIYPSKPSPSPPIVSSASHTTIYIPNHNKYHYIVPLLSISPFPFTFNSHTQNTRLSPLPPTALPTQKKTLRLQTEAARPHHTHIISTLASTPSSSLTLDHHRYPNSNKPHRDVGWRGQPRPVMDVTNDKTMDFRLRIMSERLRISLRCLRVSRSRIQALRESLG